MSEIKNVGSTWMASNTCKRNYLTPLDFKGIITYSTNVIMTFRSM